MASLDVDSLFINIALDETINIFVLFESETQFESFKNSMNTYHPKMKFTFEKEQSNCFNFLDVKGIRENNVFTTSVYRKP